MTWYGLLTLVAIILGWCSGQRSNRHRIEQYEANKRDAMVPRAVIERAARK